MSVKCSAWVWSSSTVAGNELLVMLALADEADDDGVSWPGVVRLAQKARAAQSTVRHALDRLEEAGEIVRVFPARRGRGHYTRFVLRMGRTHEEALAALDEPQRPSQTARRGPTVARCTTPPEDVGPDAHKATVVTLGDDVHGDAGLTSPPPKGAGIRHLSPDRVPEKGARRCQKVPTVERKTATPKDPKTLACLPAARERDVDPVVVDLAEALRARQVTVRWDLTRREQQAVIAAVDRAGAVALVEHAAACVAARGAPVSAKAWIDGWGQLRPAATATRPPPAPPRPWCGRCSTPGQRRVIRPDGNLGPPCPDCTASPF